MLLLVVTLTIRDSCVADSRRGRVHLAADPARLRRHRRRSQPTFALRDRIADVARRQEGLTGVRVASLAREHEHEQAYRAHSWSLVRVARAALVNMRFFP
jgi:hypothetical protein